LSFFWDVMRRLLVVSCRRFGTTHWCHLQELSSPRRRLKIGLLGFPKRR